MPPLHLLIKPASGLCNMRCRYCFYYDETRKRETESFGMMDLDTLEIIVKKSLDFAEGDCTFAFQGGEPTLAGLEFYRTLLEFEKRYNRKNLSIHNAIQTNGYRITEDWARFLADNHFLTGLSLDGTRHTHDASRIDAEGNPTFFDVVHTAELFNRYHVEYNLLTVVTAQTAKAVRKIYPYFRKMHYDYLQFIPCMDPLDETPGGMEYSLTPELYGTFLCDLFDLWYLDLVQGRGCYIRQFENYVGMLLNRPPEACDMNGICSAQHVIEADGSVYPCDFYVLDGLRLGSLKTNTFEQIARKRSELHFIENSAVTVPECLSCPWYSLCRNGCRRYREHQDGNSKNYFCASYRKFFEHSIERLKQIAANIRPTLKQ